MAQRRECGGGLCGGGWGYRSVTTMKIAVRMLIDTATWLGESQVVGAIGIER